jgi:hypothetical protein
MKHLQNNPETFETLETDAYNMQFRAKHLLAAWRMEARRYVEKASLPNLKKASLPNSIHTIVIVISISITKT